MVRLIVLDRDGVLNYDSEHYIRSPEELVLIPSSLAAVARLTAAHYPVVIATNQSGIGRGYFSLQTLELIHTKLLSEIRAAQGEIQKIFYCPHTPEAQCSCRKPQPGMLLQSAAAFNLQPTELLMVGDSWSDILAAKNCGARAVMVQTGKAQGVDAQQAERAGVPSYANLFEFVQHFTS